MFIRIGTRPSPLALKQTEEIISDLRKFYTDFKFQIKPISTTGDKDKITSISEVEGTDFFTREIEQELLNGEIDLAVHSAKDLPDEIPKGLIISVITKSVDPYDALVSKDNLKIDELKIGAKIGVSSKRRKTQLKIYRKDFQVVNIRGHIQERLKKLNTDSLDALVVAACALVRLGLENRITQRIPFKILKPHPLQGCLAIEARANDERVINLTRVLNEKNG